MHSSYPAVSVYKKQPPTSITMNQKFPFNQCDDAHLMDSVAIIKRQLNLTLYFSLSNSEQTIDECPFDCSSADLDDVESLCLCNTQESTIEQDYESQEDFHMVPSPIFYPVDPPKPSLKQISHRSNGKYSQVYALAKNKLYHYVERQFSSVTHDDHFNEIRNYVINYFFESFGDVELVQLCERILDHKYKRVIIEKLTTLFVEKYEEMKVESFVDYFHNVLNLKEKCHTTDPKLYHKYYKIWKLQIKNYRYYDEEYFFEQYFTDQDSLVMNSFILNFSWFVNYFARDIMNKPYEDDYDEDDADVATDGSNGMDQIINERHNRQKQPLADEPFSISQPKNSLVLKERIEPLELSHKEKRLRFNEDINVININRCLPVDQVIYNKFVQGLM